MKNHRYFVNKKCEYFPCHKLKKFSSCLFCYCPLYTTECFGTYTLTVGGIKDCSNCTIPHTEYGCDKIIIQISEIN